MGKVLLRVLGVNQKTASNVMNRGQCLAGEMFVHRSVSYLNLLGKNGFLRSHR